MTTEQLFIETLGDLERRVHPAPSEYEVLGAAALLRKLLLDDQPLVDHVNRGPRLRIRYTITDTTPIWQLAGGPRPSYWSIQDGLDPETAMRPAQTVDVARDQLLSKVVMISGEREVTVRDVILFCAHVCGAVHRGAPRSELQREMNRAAETFAVGGYASGIRDLQAIGRIVLGGLRPLHDAVRSNL
jgi:hypothetical protein